MGTGRDTPLALPYSTLVTSRPSEMVTADYDTMVIEVNFYSTILHHTCHGYYNRKNLVFLFKSEHYEFASVARIPANWAGNSRIRWRPPRCSRSV
jgi:hypothetical protein